MKQPGPQTSTLWTQVIEVIQKGEGPAAERALNDFCEHYRPVIVGFFGQRGWTPEQAEDLTHDFFASRILSRLDSREGFLHRARRGGTGNSGRGLAQLLQRKQISHA